jgi:phospholipase/lecithinase/hemolysin
MKGRNTLAFTALLSLSLLAPRAFAASYSEIVSFGDSLSDNGNASIGTLGAEPGSNYAYRSVAGVPFPVGEFTDGPTTTPGTPSPTGLWNEQLAADLGLAALVPALAPGGGTDYAVGGATTGSNGLSDMQDQVNLFISQHPASAPTDALYTFWGGANDILAAGSPTAAADNIAAEIRNVATDGGKTFLWLNLPLLGDTPQGAAAATILNAASAAFNSEWAADISALHAQGVNVIGVDVGALFESLIINPAAYGFTNASAPAQGVTGANPDKYVFWDQLHPTTEADMYVANLALADLKSVPEPATGAALLFIGAGAMARRRARA